MNQSSDDNPDLDEVQELTPEMTGRWLVRGDGTDHLWDLDAMTYVRIPFDASRGGSLPLDNRVLKINRVLWWPRIGYSSFIWVDHPDNPVLEHWRRSSQVRSIRRMPSNPLKDTPKA